MKGSGTLRLGLAAMAACLLPAIADAQAPPPEPTPTPAVAAPAQVPTFASQIELVTVDAVVVDKKGNAITGLTRDDFVVEEDGAPQNISSFEAVELPDAPAAAPPPPPPVSTNVRNEEQAWTGRSFVIVFDDIHLTPFQAQHAKKAVVEFLGKATREGDRVALVSTGGEAWWSTRMMGGRDALIALLKRLDGRHIPDRSPDRISPYEAMRIFAYNDPQVEDRVSRRLQTYGATQDRNRFQRESAGAYGTVDPFVRARASDVYFQAIARLRLTLKVMERVLDSLVGAKGRKSVVLVSEGFILDPNIREFKDVIQASRRSNAAIYYLDTRGLEGLPDYLSAEFGPALDTQDIGSAFIEGVERAHGSESLALDSGGFVVKNTNDLAKGIQRIGRELQAYYLIGYYPTNSSRDGKFRKIDVEVNRPGTKVRARKGYYAPSDETLPPEEKPTVDPAFQRALDSPFEEDGVPLRMTDYVFGETLVGKASAAVTAEVDLSNFGFRPQEIQGQRRMVDALEFLMVVAHRDTGEYYRYDQKIEMKLRPETLEKLRASWLPISRDFELAPGAYQAKLVARDANTGRVGTVVHEFEVPDLSSLRTSSLMLTNELQNPESVGTDEHPRPKMVAHRQFPVGGTLYCQYDVYGARKDPDTGMPRVTAGYSIVSAAGGVVRSMLPSEIHPTSLGSLSRLFGTDLDGVPAGQYEVVVALTDEVAGRSFEVREPFWLE